MKILCMLPAGKGVYPVEAEERRLKLMRSYTTPGTQVDADYMPAVSGFSPWGGTPDQPRNPSAAERAGQLSVQRAIQAEQEGYDAFCPFGTLDIGVLEARQRVKIPVVGQTEACLLTCGMLDRKFGWVTYQPGSEEANFATARAYGVGHLMVAAASIGIPNSEYPQRRGELLEQFIRCAEESRAKGAELIGVVAMSICPTEYSAKELSAACGMPVIDALATQIGFAELWHRVGIPTSLIRHPRGGSD